MWRNGTSHKESLPRCLRQTLPSMAKLAFFLPSTSQLLELTTEAKRLPEALVIHWSFQAFWNNKIGTGNCSIFKMRDSCFSAEDALSYPEIKEQTSMNDDDLTRSLHSLSCAKYKLLIKDPKSNRINKTDKFVFNSEFTDKAKRIKVIALFFSATFYRSCSQLDDHIQV